MQKKARRKLDFPTIWLNVTSNELRVTLKHAFTVILLVISFRISTRRCFEYALSLRYDTWQVSFIILRILSICHTVCDCVSK